MAHSVYIHIPFCKNICSYCAFCKVYYKSHWVDQYLIKLEEEIDSYYQKEPMQTIYIGGGTPSSLSLEQLEKLLQIVSKFQKTDCYEYTIECNIEDIDLSMILMFKKYHVNRISLGIQTFFDKHLRFLNRMSKEDRVKKMIFLLKEHGFNNINIDLMYALKEQTLEELKEDLNKVFSLGVTHISTYSLMVEPHTKLFLDQISPVDEDLDRQMYDFIGNQLEKKGFQQYEISNFAKEGYHSIHNQTYWNNEEYYGFGLSASGYLKNVRYTNTKNLSEYLNGKFNRVEEIINLEEKRQYEMILGLRKVKGVDKNLFYQKYHQTIFKAFPFVPLMLQNHFLEENDHFIFIPRNKLYISNEILWHFLKY